MQQPRRKPLTTTGGPIAPLVICLVAMSLALPVLGGRFELAGQTASPVRPSRPETSGAPAPPRRRAPLGLKAQRNGRLFPPHDLGLLEAPGPRSSGRSPIRSWTRSASPTARSSPTSARGGGWFTLRLARRVGPNGLVYAAGHPAADDRGDQPPRAARESAQRPDGARHSRPIRICRAASTRC